MAVTLNVVIMAAIFQKWEKTEGTDMYRRVHILKSYPSARRSSTRRNNPSCCGCDSYYTYPHDIHPRISTVLCPRHNFTCTYTWINIYTCTLLSPLIRHWPTYWTYPKLLTYFLCIVQVPNDLSRNFNSLLIFIHIYNVCKSAYAQYPQITNN